MNFLQTSIASYGGKVQKDPKWETVEIIFVIKNPKQNTTEIRKLLYPNYAQSGFFHKGILNSVINLHKLYFWCEFPLLKITYSAHMGSLKEQKFYEGP